ncbi:hypothetical protein HDV57DRAFT_214977 [Trichoderma longibrachiatum]|uniref:Uncharacterized protein n=1 Tax=Trichoderma longibrachiatum ATCC 18648 TaxID=983965 RepID=A0A2T4C7Y9_TRILO|nr:hypothetical protein M440DRAFT_286698 [Trichoderma longibrachiatum ATCC 18648]
MSNAGQWYHPRLVIKTNISTLLLNTTRIKTRSLVSLLLLSLSSRFLVFIFHFFACQIGDFASVSDSLRFKAKRTYQKGTRPREEKGEIGTRVVEDESGSCYFLKGQKKNKEHEPNQKGQKTGWPTINNQMMRTHWPLSGGGWQRMKGKG